MVAKDATAAQLSEAVSAGLDFIVVGGGILGTTIAALAGSAGLRVLVLRLHDEGAPRADTLRNQGWLQSGLMYSRSRFKSDSHYLTGVEMAFQNGPRLLRMCGLPRSQSQGLIQVKDEKRIEDLMVKAKALRLRNEVFREVGFDEAQLLAGELVNRGSRYFLIPDTPFDEAGVLTHLRDVAMASGAIFHQLDRPAEIASRGSVVQIKCGELVLNSPLTFVAAGAGTVKCYSGVTGQAPPLDLQHTPLMIHNGLNDMRAGLFVDVELGYSAVGHQIGNADARAFVIGTRENTRNKDRDPYASRAIDEATVLNFRDHLHPSLRPHVNGARFTGGCELIPDNHPLVEPWLKDCGSVIFGSPGRATVALAAAQEALDLIFERLAELGRPRFHFASQSATAWERPIRMHYAPTYTYNDAA